MEPGEGQMGNVGSEVLNAADSDMKAPKPTKSKGSNPQRRMPWLRRFAMLSPWNKLAALGAIASILGLLVYFFWPNSTQRFDIYQNPQTGPAIAHVDKLIINYGRSATELEAEIGQVLAEIEARLRNSLIPSQAEMIAARKELVSELQANLWKANEHLGLASTLLDAQLWPPEALAQSLEVVRIRISERPFSRAAYVAARTRSELRADDKWDAVEAFYTHLEEGATVNTRNVLETLESVIRMPTPGTDIVCMALETWASTLEGNYHVLNSLGQIALEQYLEEAELQDLVSHAKFLQNASAEAGPNALSVRLGAMCARAPRSDPFGILCASLIVKLKELEDDLQNHVETAVQARSLNCESAARKTYEQIIRRFPQDQVTVEYAKTGLDQLNHPERYHGIKGLFVTDFASNSPGRDAGFLVGDLFLSYDGRPLETIGELVAAIANSDKAQVPVTLIRGEKQIELACPRGRLGVEFKAF